MKITTGLALPIVHKLMAALDFNVNIMDENGIIVASGDPERIGRQHEGALRVLQLNRQLIIREHDAGALHGSKPGVNLPVEFQGKIVGAVGITGDPDEVYKFGTIIKMNVEVLLQQIHMNKQMQFRKMALDSWIAELINPHEFSGKKLRAAARPLELDVDSERCVVLAEINELKWGEETVSPDQLHMINERREQLFHDLRAVLDYQAVCAYLEEGVFFMAIPAKEAQKREFHIRAEEYLLKHGYHFRMGIGSPGKGPEGYRDSYLEALQSVRLMNKLGGENRAAYIGDWGIIPFLDTVPQDVQQAFLRQYLPAGQVLSEEYKQTLKVYFECELDAKQAASLLHIHRNTLFYRLDRLSRQLQLDYRKFSDLLVMKLLLVFEQLQRHEPDANQ
ncbi:MAG: hypothetical protein K0R57_6123 [Paenibacillaceae bacterium]|jgi:carbohydrate diacid regulator|nr:hypothetical protein [Paenibacillaceae bacterium]